MTSLPTLSVIVPALNEEANIADAVREATRALGERFSDYELLLFNDGSTDRTGEIMDALALEDPHIRVFHHERQRTRAALVLDQSANATLGKPLAVGLARIPLVGQHGLYSR